MKDTRAAKDNLLDDFSAVIADSQELLRAMASASGERADTLRGDLNRKLGDARARLSNLQDSALERGRAAVTYTDDYVRENPWQSIAIGAGVAAVVGIAIGLVLADRR
jgi:ElaB/YqjD/DUF883 family membrane-anchored ribosome-binding protein